MASIQLPKQLPLFLIDGILFPGSSIRIPITTQKNLTMVKKQLLIRNSVASTIIGVVPKERNREEEEDGVKQARIHKVGTAGIVVQISGTNWPNQSYSIMVTGLCRFRIESMEETPSGLIGTVCQLDRLPGEHAALKEKNDEELTQLMDKFREQISKLVDMLELSGSSERILSSVPIESLPDICASVVKASHNERLEILDAVDITERFRKTLPLLARQIEKNEKDLRDFAAIICYKILYLTKIQKGRNNKEVSWPMDIGKIVLTRTRNPIRRMECDDLEDGDEVSLLEKKFRETELSEAAKKVVSKELRRLKKMPPHVPEHAVTRNYIELILDLPWNKLSDEHLDLKKSKRDLDHDHFGMDKLKKRVLEFLAVRQLKNNLKAPILCFVGPPGVGKTSIGRSIAHSMGRKFHRISLGGICDQSDIRGHRRTYIGSMPGRIIQGLRVAGVKNPVFLLDEIDKMSTGVHGDPAAALLEVLDPEQNCSFTDHYVNTPFDLSQVLFIATANTVRTITPALLDRMEVIHVPGYTHFEKEYIAQNHLIPKMLDAHGLTFEQVRFTSDSVRIIIMNYTREAGVRALERKIGDLCRGVAANIVMRQSQDEEPSTDVVVPELPLEINKELLTKILGPPLFEGDPWPRLTNPGMALGLSWSVVGANVLMIEASKMKGNGSLTLTGQLGNVMKESARLALHWIRANGWRYGLSQSLMKDLDIHIHVPQGAVKKEGPSAGVTLVTVLMSLLLDQLVRPDLAMTGEISLQGMVLPVGGVKAKILAAHRYGLKQVIIPEKNKKDLAELPESVKNEMVFHLVNQVDEVLQLAFLDPTSVVPSKTLTSCSITSKL